VHVAEIAVTMTVTTTGSNSTAVEDGVSTPRSIRTCNLSGASSDALLVAVAYTSRVSRAAPDRGNQLDVQGGPRAVPAPL